MSKEGRIDFKKVRLKGRDVRRKEQFFFFNMGVRGKEFLCMLMALGRKRDRQKRDLKCLGF